MWIPSCQCKIYRSDMCSSSRRWRHFHQEIPSVPSLVSHSVFSTFSPTKLATLTPTFAGVSHHPYQTTVLLHIWAFAMAELLVQPKVEPVEAPGTLSHRGDKLSASGAVLDLFREILSNTFHPDNNHGGIINAGTSENVRALPCVWYSALRS